MTQSQWRVGDTQFSVSIDDIDLSSDMRDHNERNARVAAAAGLSTADMWDRVDAAVINVDNPIPMLIEESAPPAMNLLDSMRLVIDDEALNHRFVLYQPKLCGIATNFDLCAPTDGLTGVVGSPTSAFERKAPMRQFVPFKMDYSVRPCGAAPVPGMGTVKGLVQSAIDQISLSTSRSLARAMYIGAQDANAAGTANTVPGSSWFFYLTRPYNSANGAGAIDITPLVATVATATTVCYGFHALDAEVSKISVEGGSIYVGVDVFAAYNALWSLTKIGRRYYTRLGNLVVIDAGFDGRAPGATVAPDRSNPFRWMYATGGRPSGVAGSITSPNITNANEASYLGNAIPDSIVVTDAFGRPNNDFEARASRRFVVTYGDCAHFAIQVDISRDC